MKRIAEDMLLTIIATGMPTDCNALVLAELVGTGCIAPVTGDIIGWTVTPKGTEEAAQITAKREARENALLEARDKAQETLMEMVGNLGEDFLASWLAGACRVMSDGMETDSGSLAWEVAAKACDEAESLITEAYKAK